VVQQLQQRHYYLFLYLDALSRMDPHLVTGFANLQVLDFLSKTQPLKNNPDSGSGF